MDALHIRAFTGLRGLYLNTHVQPGNFVGFPSRAIAALRVQRSKLSYVVLARARKDDEDDDYQYDEEDEDRDETGEKKVTESGFFSRLWKRSKSGDEPETEKEEQRQEEEAEEQFVTMLWKSVVGEIDKDDNVPGFEELDIKWGELLDPSLDNVLAVILTSLLLVAVLQISWQLVLVTLAIIISGLKYTVLSAFLIAFIIFFL